MNDEHYAVWALLAALASVLTAYVLTRLEIGSAAIRGIFS